MAKSASVVASIQLKYSLAELPSSQHRAGLVGLILHIEELKKATKGVMNIVELTEESATIDLDEQGVKELFDALYEATQELQGSEKPYKDVEPDHVEEREEVDPKTNKIKIKKVYFYPVIVPRGGFLDRRDTSNKKIHVKLWRDMIWQIMRGVPATRKPFQDRASGTKAPPDSIEAWKQLSLNADKATELPSTYFIGAQATNAEGVSFQDKNKYQFLLHFWTYIAQIYRPQLVDRDAKHTFDGFCIAVPDVSSLRSFCEDFDLMLKQRNNELAGYMPRDAIISIPGEAGLDLMKRLSQSVEQTSGQAITRELVFAVDVLHVRKDGNNVRLLYAGRVEPSLKRDQEYAAITRSLKDFWFRRQRVVNLLKKLDWCTGFNRLLTELPLKQGLHSALFGQDARASFRAAEEKHKGELIMATTTQQVCLESLVLNIVGSYLRRKMKDKHDLEYSKLQSDAQKKDYVDKRESLATEAFYAVRSRNSNDDFIKYFASTICSVPQWMSADEYLSITQDLYTNTDKIRTLTMLALSARIERSDNRATKENIDND